MKKLLALLLAAMLLVSMVPAMAEQVEEESVADVVAEIPSYDKIVVGSTTAMSGSFFTSAFGENASDIDVRDLIHGYGLVRWDAENGAYGMDRSVVSGFAAQRENNGDRTYIVNIYTDLKYSDGSAITAADYAFSILLAAAPQMQEIGASVADLDYIRGMDAYQAGRSKAIAGVRMVGRYQLNITIRADYLPFFYELSLLNVRPYPISAIAPGCTVRDDGNGVYIDGTMTAATLQSTLLDPVSGYVTHPAVVSGPYTLVSYENDVATFALNEYYKGNDEGVKPTVPTLEYRYVANEDAMDALSAGDVTLLNKTMKADIIQAGMELSADPAYAVDNYARSGMSYVSFACEKPAVAEQEVRQAIAWCFDRETFVNEYVSNYGLVVDGYYGLGQWMYQLVMGTTEAPDGVNQAAWTKMTDKGLSGLKTYKLDTDKAAALLDKAGWKLNADGIREKKVNGETVTLDLKLIYPEGNEFGNGVQAVLADNLAKVGIKLTVEAVPFNDLLKVLYRQADRDADMIYLASNFSEVFDPSVTFNPGEEWQGKNNRTGIQDKKLYALAEDMSHTEPGDVLSYVNKWVSFQEYFTQVLPVIPVYSNVYFDFYSATLQDYEPSADQTWSQSIVPAYLSDVNEAEEEEGETFE